MEHACKGANPAHSGADVYSLKYEDYKDGDERYLLKLHEPIARRKGITKRIQESAREKKNKAVLKLQQSAAGKQDRED